MRHREKDLESVISQHTDVTVSLMWHIKLNQSCEVGRSLGKTDVPAANTAPPGVSMWNAQSTVGVTDYIL